MAAETREVRLDGWPEGVDDRLDSHALPPERLAAAVNVDLDANGRVRRRKGRRRIHTGTDIGEVWHGAGLILFREGGELKRAVPGAGGWSYTTLATGLRPGSRVAFLELHGDVLWTDGVKTGRIRDAVDGPWGVPRPVHAPSLTAGNVGGLHAGAYRVTTTFKTASGEESGAGPVASVTLPAAGSILVNNLPQPGAGQRTAVYLTPHNGEEFFWAGDHPAGTPSAYIGVASSDLALATWGCRPPPAGDLLAYHNGRVWIAVGSYLYKTEPLNYGLWRPTTGFAEFPAPITKLAAVSDGLYIATREQTWFRSQVDTDGEQLRQVLAYGAPPGRHAAIPADDRVAWWTERGLVIARSQGQIDNVSEPRLRPQPLAHASLHYRDERGIPQFVALLQPL